MEKSEDLMLDDMGFLGLHGMLLPWSTLHLIDSHR